MEQLSLNHVQGLFELTDANRQHLRQWLPWVDSIKTVADTQGFINAAIEQYQQGKGPQFALFHEGLLCGVNGFHRINAPSHCGSIGYWLAAESIGKGIITQTTKQLLEIGFTEHCLNKVEIRCATANIKSRAIAERLGFLFEGTLRQSEFLYDHYVDHAVYSLLRSEYEVLRG